MDQHDLNHLVERERRHPIFQDIAGSTMESLILYVTKSVPVGGFLEAVLSNDLKEAMGRADEQNRTSLFAIVSWLYSQAPASCWGSPEKYAAWLKGR